MGFEVVGGVEWRQKIDAQSGAVLATEFKNNSCKLARWTAQSILAGAEQMKLGYVSRVARTNPYDHVVLATQFYKPKEFATQITLNVNNMWGIIKMLVDLLLDKDDGKVCHCAGRVEASGSDLRGASQYAPKVMIARTTTRWWREEESESD